MITTGLENPLRAYREDQQISQQELANELKKTRQVVTNIEGGLLYNLPIDFAKKINPQNPEIPQQHYKAWVHMQRLRNSHYFQTPEALFILSRPFQRFGTDQRHSGIGKNKWRAFKLAVEVGIVPEVQKYGMMQYSQEDMMYLGSLAYWDSVDDVSHRGFCRKLIYQPSMLTLYEKRNQCKPSLMEALQAVGLSQKDIHGLGVRLDNDNQ